MWRKRRWSDAMLAATGLDESHMPKLFEGNEITGELRAELAEAWGMARVPVVAGGGDNAAGAVGVGVVRPGDAFLSLGTSGVLFLANDGYRPNPAGGVHTFCHAVPKHWHQMSVILSAASCVDWAARLCGLENAAALFALAEARSRPTNSEIFLPYLSGERTPHNDPNAQGVLFGLTHETDPAAIAQAVLEGVAFAFRDGMDALLASGANIESIAVIGGGARSAYWGKILSSVLRRPLTYRDSGAVGPAYGAARLARMGAEKASIEDICTPPPILHVAEPDDRLIDLYRKKMGRYRSLYQNLKDLFRETRTLNRSYFGEIAPIAFEGPQSTNPLAYRFYDKNRVVLGKTMEQQLRMAVCYWHTFDWDGFDVFGAGTFRRPWHGGPLDQAAADHKLNEAFEFFTRLGLPYFCFHDVDVMAQAANIREHVANFSHMVDKIQAKMSATGVKLLWGTANLFSHPRYMAGAATNPDPEVFRFAATQVRHCLEATHRLHGENYVLWGGREGYDTLLNTNLRQEKNQLGRFMSMVVEHKHKIGFKGAILIEPKPHEPTKHQYDFDVDTIYGFLKHHGLEKEVKVNIESNHATLSGHSFEHEIAMAVDFGIFGSIDMNRGDPQNGWDTDQFPNEVREITLALYYVLQGGGFTSGGNNFDAKVRRQSIDPIDLFYGHIGAVDMLARGLLSAAAMLTGGEMKSFVEQRYAGWRGAQARDMLEGRSSLAAIADAAVAENVAPVPRSGRQEYLENLVSRYTSG